MKNPYQKKLILRGLMSIEKIESPEERASFLEAAATLLPDEDLGAKCASAARCLREAEAAQIRLFDSIRPSH